MAGSFENTHLFPLRSAEQICLDIQMYIQHLQDIRGVTISLATLCIVCVFTTIEEQNCRQTTRGEFFRNITRTKPSLPTDRTSSDKHPPVRARRAISAVMFWVLRRLMSMLEET